MRRITKVAAIAATALTALIATGSAASAAVTVKPDGSVFVGKGDVQSALDYNNKQMQESVEAGKGSLAFSQQQEWQYVWDWTDSAGVPHHVHLSATSDRAMAAAEARTNSNGKDGPLTGWTLTTGGEWSPMTPYTFHGDDVDGNGVVNYADVQPTWPGGNPLATYNVTTLVNGEAL